MLIYKGKKNDSVWNFILDTVGWVVLVLEPILS